MGTASEQVGEVVVPARNGYLHKLGYDIEALDLKALGLILDDGPKRSLVSFPELSLALWLDNQEFAVVSKMADGGDESYQGLMKAYDDLQKVELVWSLSFLCKNLPVVEVLELEAGVLSEIWDPADQENLSDFWEGDDSIKTGRFALGLSSFTPQMKKHVEEALGSRLLFHHIRPSGMHKFEASFYLSF